MTRDNARREIRSQWRPLLRDMSREAKDRVNGETTYICPLCGHGTNGDGITFNPQSYDRNGLKCFGCGFSGDIIDLFQQKYGFSYSEALTMCAEHLGIDIDTGVTSDQAFSPEPSQMPTERPHDAAHTREGNNIGDGRKSQQEAPSEREQADLTAYYRECVSRLTDPAAVSYLNGRGISIQTARAYWIGYDPAADPAGKGHPAPRIIMPTSSTHYVGRSIDPNADKRYQKVNNAGGSAGIFNLNALYKEEAGAVFVTEGVFDALSVLEVGYDAISLNSTSNRRKLLEALEARPTASTIVLCLDNDAAGKTASEELRKGLTKLNISFVVANISGKYKDPNEHLTEDRNGFVSAVEQANFLTSKRPDNVSSYMEHFMVGEIERFKMNKGRKTGFDNLDSKIESLYPGLYALAAISSLGKTTFTHQMADQLAEAGHDVIFFSMEQSRLEMVSKSLSRMTAKDDIENAVSSLSIRKGYLPTQVQRAIMAYPQKVGDRISIVEGNFNCNISFIGDYIRRYIKRTDTRPIVFIDYLQILQPEMVGNRMQTTKETVDTTVTELKRLSRELDLTIFVISSVNRANYLTPIDFESFKESGGIEYTCDCAWGLQFRCLEEKVFDSATNIKEKRARITQAKEETPRQIELKCLKNRFGPAVWSCYFKYYPQYDLFVDDGTREESSPAKTKAMKRI